MKILICSENPIFMKQIIGLSIEGGWKTSISEHPADAIRKVIKEDFDVVISDTGSAGLSGTDALNIIRHLCPGTEVLLTGEKTPPGYSELPFLYYNDYRGIKSYIEDVQRRKNKKGGTDDTKRSYAYGI
ncbi:MAG: hypothetical protein D6726_06585 [Nitrospirae bacterium]|nr:MAG: hypothetical protein D6726_06585 [Nitrospirota bacterium]